MPEQDQTQCSIEIPDDSIIDWIIDSATEADATPQPSSTARIPRVLRSMVSEKHDYNKYYVPKHISIGPYYFGEPRLQVFQKLKPVFTMRLLAGNKETLRSLYNKLCEPEMVKDLRSFYEENSTSKYCDKVFTKMMLLDSCFILHIIFTGLTRSFEGSQELVNDNPKLTFFVFQDLLLLQNQIPFKLLRVVMRLANLYDLSKICRFILRFELAVFRRDAKNLAQRLEAGIIDNEPNHLLHLLHRTRAPQYIKHPINDYNYNRNNFPTVNQLLDVGTRFKQCDTISLEYVKFSIGCCGFSAAVRLPPINVYEPTKPIFLNLIAYEVCSSKDAWVTSYVCLLHSLIGSHEDVKVLRNAGVLENWLGTDNDVVELFNEIATDLVPHNFAYIRVKDKLQSHYEGWSNTSISQLRHEYRKSPWKFLSLFGAVIALFLSAVQTYFTVWSLK